MIARAVTALSGVAVLAATLAAAPPLPDDGGKFPLAPPDAPPPAAEVTTGSLAIRAVQGTPDGPPVGEADVIVQLVHQGTVVQSYEDRLDEHGVLVLEELPIAMGVTPVVEVAHAGVTYRQSGPPLTPAAPEQMLEIVCYEVTDEAPEWCVEMRHVMVTDDPDGLHVNEIIVIENPAARTWLGAPQPEGKARTTTFRLTPGAKDVQLGRGFHDWCCTTFRSGELVNHLPLMPARTEMQFRYALPSDGSQTMLDIHAPATMHHLMVIVPDSIAATPLEGLEPAGGSTIGETRVQFFVGNEIAAGQRASVELVRGGGSIAATPPAGGGSAPVSIVKVIAAIGGGILVMIAVVVMLSRSPRPAASE